MLIKRRVPALNVDNRPIPGRFEEKWEEAELVFRGIKKHTFRLKNGDTIQRKDVDVNWLGASL